LVTIYRDMDVLISPANSAASAGALPAFHFTPSPLPSAYFGMM
jgi:hypothetical protein